VLDATRCLPMRFSDSSCKHCVDICPHRAVSLDGFLAINPNHCSGCMLCTAVCPAGALELNIDFQATLAQLSRVPEPVLGCRLTAECSNATLPCLGGLSEEHLLSLSHSLSGKLTLNAVKCSDCPNGIMISRLQQLLGELCNSGLSGSSCQIVIALSAPELHYRPEAVDRRGFFKSFRNSLFQGAAAILSSNSENPVKSTEYIGKKLPARMALLNQTLSRLTPELRSRVLGRYGHQISFNDSCTACQGCVAICPTGALRTESPDDHPFFDQSLCTGCALCVEFCMDEALKLAGAERGQ